MLEVRTFQRHSRESSTNELRLVLCCEYMPSGQRGRSIYILSCFWALGVVVMLSLLFLTLGNTGNWRIFVAIGALPAFLAMIMMRFFPESFRFLMVTNQYFAANEILAEMAESNEKELPGHLQILPKQRRRGKVFDLFRFSYARSTLLFWSMGLATGISFLGLNIITPHLLLEERENVLAVNVTTMNFMGNMSSPIPCLKDMSVDDFILSVWTSALDFPGFVIYIILVDVVDRKKLLCGSYVLSSFFIFLLLIPSKNVTMLAGFAYAARTLLVSQFDMLLLTVAEAYPTTQRGTAVGMEAATFCLGQFLSSYIAEGLLMFSFKAPVILYGALAFAGAIASNCLTQETREKELEDIIKK